MININLKGGSLARNPKLVKFIIVHCSATPPGMDVGVDEIRRWHLDRGFNDIGYHYVIKRDGTIEEGRPLGKPGAHCKGKNFCSVGVCYVGGVAKDGRTPADNRTEQQQKSLRELIGALLKIFPDAEVRGHRDFAPKACPSFDATAQYKGLRKLLIPVLLILMFGTSIAGCSASSRTTRHEDAGGSHILESSLHALVLQSVFDSCELIIENPQIAVKTADSTQVNLSAKNAVFTRRKSTKTVDRQEEAAKVDDKFTLTRTNAQDKKMKGGAKIGYLLTGVFAIFVILTIIKIKKNLL